MILFVSLVVLTVIVAEPLTDPVSPAAYQDIIKQGFATNYFKTDPPAKKYGEQNIQDIYNKGFRNVRLRCRADLYTAPYNDQDFAIFLTKLTSVVDKCIEVGVAPIISWIHPDAEAWATEADRQNYLTWWTAVANQLKDKDFRLSFNLFTELGKDVCQDDCTESLRGNTAKYNDWTSAVVQAIRGTQSNNAQRIVILASPKKTAKGLVDIDPSIYQNDPYMLVEWHLYAGGPNKVEGSAKYWSGDGSTVGQQNIHDAIQPALDFTNTTGQLTYFGAWMAEDQQGGALNQNEIVSFCEYFVAQLRELGIPWSLNVLDRYYTTTTNAWRSEVQNLKGQQLNMETVLNAIINKMQDS